MSLNNTETAGSNDRYETTDETMPVKVVIELFDGCVSKVTSDAPLDVVVLDNNIGTAVSVVQIDGQQMAFHHIDSEVDDDKCQVVFREVADHDELG